MRPPGETVNATELTEFFLKRKGRCFEGWSEEKIFNYVLVNCVHGNVFFARTPGEGARPAGPIALAAIAWLGDAATIKHKAELDSPQFSWDGFSEQQSPDRKGAGFCLARSMGNRSLTVGAQLDSILIADVAGDRRFMPEILKQVMARRVPAPPAIFQKRLFTYRRGKLVELSWATVRRFFQQSRAREQAEEPSFCALETNPLPYGRGSVNSVNRKYMRQSIIFHLPSPIF